MTSADGVVEVGSALDQGKAGTLASGDRDLSVLEVGRRLAVAVFDERAGVEVGLGDRCEAVQVTLSPAGSSDVDGAGQAR